MQLNVKERLVLPSILQEKGSLSEQMTKESIIRKIALTDDEKEAFMVKYNETGTVTWNHNQFLITTIWNYLKGNSIHKTALHINVQETLNKLFIIRCQTL